MKRIDPAVQVVLFAMDFVIAVFALLLGMPEAIAVVVLAHGLALLLNACLPSREPETSTKQEAPNE